MDNKEGGSLSGVLREDSPRTSEYLVRPTESSDSILSARSTRLIVRPSVWGSKTNAAMVPRRGRARLSAGQAAAYR